jgi:ribosome-associated heat shock protein Hsp15
MMGMETSSEPMRLDKWLWAARLVKTRGLAVEAVNGGRVQLNGQRAKPSKDVRPGDRLEITIGQLRRTVVIQGTAPRRGPASEAALLYEETPESLRERERQAAERRLADPPGVQSGTRPTKRDRRRFEATRGSRGGRRQRG